MTASFEEKSAWAQALAITIGLGAYFVIAGRMLAEGERAMAAFAGVLAAAVLVVLVLIVGQVSASLSGRVQREDERDRAIAYRAEYRSGWVMATGLVAGVACLAMGVEAVWVANLLLLALATAQLLSLGLRLVSYRRGA